jgi:hypothetical protein
MELSDFAHALTPRRTTGNKGRYDFSKLFNGRVHLLIQGGPGEDGYDLVAGRDADYARVATQNKLYEAARKLGQAIAMTVVRDGQARLASGEVTLPECTGNGLLVQAIGEADAAKGRAYCEMVEAHNALAAKIRKAKDAVEQASKAQEALLAQADADPSAIEAAEITFLHCKATLAGLEAQKDPAAAKKAAEEAAAAKKAAEELAAQQAKAGAANSSRTAEQLGRRKAK